MIVGGTPSRLSSAATTDFSPRATLSTALKAGTCLVWACNIGFVSAYNLSFS